MEPAMIADYVIGCACAREELEVCAQCGMPAGEGECEDEVCQMIPANDDEKVDLRPVKNCRQHGWCDGCSSPSCECQAP